MDNTRIKKAIHRTVSTFAQLVGTPVPEKYKPTFEWKPTLKPLRANFKWNKIRR